VGSEEALEIVLYLYEHRDRAWTPDEIRLRLHIDLDATASSSTIVNRRLELRLTDLVERGLVQLYAQTSSYRFASSDPHHAEFVEQLFVNGRDREEALGLIYLRPKPEKERRRRLAL